MTDLSKPVSQVNSTPAAAVPRHPSRLMLIEGLRGLAAMYVFFCHFALIRLHLERGKSALVFQFGGEAVMLFFLVSGFVIYNSVRNKPQVSAREYFSRRFLRIYPIFGLALVASYVLVHTGGNLLGNIFMLQDLQNARPGVWFAPYSGDIPLWSLSYEWWFYLMFFPLFRFVHEDRRQFYVIGLCAIGAVIYPIWPNQVSLFLMFFCIWWAGVELARSLHTGIKLSIRSQIKSFVVLSAMLLYFAAWTAIDAAKHMPLAFGMHPVLEARNFLTALIMLFVACAITPTGKKRLMRLVRPFCLLAPISYAIYVLHTPLVVDAHYLSALPEPVALPIYLIVFFAVAFLAEVPFQRFINYLAQPILRQEGAVRASEVSIRP